MAGTLALRHDDRMVLGFLLLPFLLVAYSLTMQSPRHADGHWSADTAVHVPTVRATPPAASKPSSIAAPLPALPAPSVPSAEVRSAPVQVAVSTPIAPMPAAPPQMTVPGSVAYPPPQPWIETPVAVAETFVPAGNLAYPPPVPEITIAALDVRPLPSVSSPLSLPVPSPLPVPSAIAMAPIPAVPEMCAATAPQLASFGSVGRLARSPRLPRLMGVDAETFGLRVAAAAVAQTRDLVIYTARYQAMAYPMGDVVSLHGACIDVVIRAYRAVGIDLQEEVQKARPGRGDPNIDHRRTENMRRFLERNGVSLPITNFPEDYKPGDIVTYHRPFSRISTSHIAVVSDVLAATGRPMIVHNRGYGAQLEDALFVDRITGHYRYTGGALPVSTPVPREAKAVVRRERQLVGADPNAIPTVTGSLTR